MYVLWDKLIKYLDYYVLFIFSIFERIFLNRNSSIPNLNNSNVSITCFSGFYKNLCFCQFTVKFYLNFSNSLILGNNFYTISKSTYFVHYILSSNLSIWIKIIFSHSLLIFLKSSVESFIFLFNPMIYDYSLSILLLLN